MHTHPCLCTPMHVCVPRQGSARVLVTMGHTLAQVPLPPAPPVGVPEHDRPRCAPHDGRRAAWLATGFGEVGERFALTA